MPYIDDVLIYIVNNKFKIAMLAVVVSVLGTSMFSITTLTANAQSAYNIKVAKTALNDFTVKDGASYIGSSFDTTYKMTGTPADFTKGTDTLISSVTEDFDKSPTIGYITMDKTNTETSGNTTGSANPFVSKEQVNEKIKSVLMSAIDKIENPGGLQIKIGDTNEIKCEFGNVLNEFNCEIPSFQFS
jgi:hypothetical protein